MRITAFYLTVLVASSAGLAFELLFGTVASYLLGDSITQFATLTGRPSRVPRCFVQFSSGSWD
jgi:spermidine synthase